MAKHIEDLGAQTFLDDANIVVGEDFEDKILKSLRSADELLVLLTPWSLTRPYVWMEIGAAWSRGKPVVGILYGLTPEQLQTQAGVPNLVKRKDLLDLNCFDTYLNQLEKRMKQQK